MEAWAPIAEWEGVYSVSDAGRVRSECRTVPRKDGRTNTYRERILSPGIVESGHRQVKLWRDSTWHVRMLHRLVLETFVGPCPAGMECLHRDGDPSNNAVANLHWGTPSENRRDSVRHGTHAMSRRTHCHRNHPFTEENTKLTPRGDTGRVYRICKECRRIDSQIARDRRSALAGTAS